VRRSWSTCSSTTTTAWNACSRPARAPRRVRRRDDRRYAGAL